VKATLFNRQDFIERSRAFVPVYIDGDSPGAQKLGMRFKVRGYPTMVLFTPEGTELTRLPGEVDARQYNEVLQLGLGARRPVKAVLEAALAGGDAARSLTASDWRLLAFYAWDTDEQQALAKERVATALRQLAAACPADQADTANRLLLKAVAAAERAPDALPRVMKLLADAGASRSLMDVLGNNAAEIVNATSLAGSPERARLLEAFDAALKRLEADATLSRADRATALLARVELARIGLAKDARPNPPSGLLADLREQAARDDREITDGYERQAVITTAAYALGQAGLLDESDALLKANLGRSHSPYYLMSELAANARKRGDAAGALRWSEEAFAKSVGPATRLQWGASHVNALVELAPQDEARIERTVQQLFTEAAAEPHAFYERSARSLQRVGDTLQAWNRGQQHRAVMARLQAQLDGVCARLPAADPQRGVCEGLLKPGAPPSPRPA
jgi:hypothetical protein